MSRGSRTGLPDLALDREFSAAQSRRNGVEFPADTNNHIDSSNPSRSASPKSLNRETVGHLQERRFVTGEADFGRPDGAACRVRSSFGEGVRVVGGRSGWRGPLSVEPVGTAHVVDEVGEADFDGCPRDPDRSHDEGHRPLLAGEHVLDRAADL